ncbi:MAG TPA: aldo/keto reductase [Chitinophagaceae bacterium]|nr:aldo/keto reductase [Chitinophagaceae bacterium]
MPQRKLGSQGLEVSALGLGCMGMNYHRGPVPDKKTMISLIHQAVDLGITLFDTAEVYGPYTNEELVGEALSNYKYSTAIATKFGFDIHNGRTIGLNSRPEQIRQVAEQALKRLKREVIDLFYQHRMDPSVPIEEVAGLVKDLVKEGKVKYFGLCEVSADTVRKAHAILPISAVQSEYSLMWREPEETLFPSLEELNIGFVSYSPVGRAYLTGALNENSKFSAENDNRADLPRFEPEALKANQGMIDAIRDFGLSNDLTPSQVALGWLLNKRDWIVPIPGTTKLNHLKENLVSATLTVSVSEWKSLEDTIAKINIIGDRYPANQQKQVGK